MESTIWNYPTRFLSKSYNQRSLPDLRSQPVKMPLVLPISPEARFKLNLMISTDISKYQLPPRPQRHLEGVQSRYLKYGKSDPITLVQEPNKLSYMDPSEPNIMIKRRIYQPNEVAPLTKKSSLWPLTVDDQRAVLLNSQLTTGLKVKANFTRFHDAQQFKRAQF